MTSTSPAPSAVDTGNTASRVRVHPSLRIATWAIVLLLGGFQAWTARFSMNPDGVSYLDIGDAYWRHDWHNAVNGLWSPLYSWILGVVLNAIKPGLRGEYPTVHAINLIILAFSFGCFEYLLFTLLERVAERHHNHLEKPFYVFGLSVFLMSSLVLIGIRTVSPDMLAAGIFFLATAMLLQIGKGVTNWKRFVSFGVVLGFGYLSRAVMFPLGFIFIAALGLIIGISRPALRNVAFALAAFLVVTIPFVAALSVEQQHLTFGNAGTWNYAFYVNRQPFWVYSADPNGAQNTSLCLSLSPKLRAVSEKPPIYHFAGSTGTFPPWFDPTQWSNKLRIHSSLRQILPRLIEAARLFSRLVMTNFLPALLGVFVLLLRSVSRTTVRTRDLWLSTLPALISCLLFSIVHTETRYIAASIAVLIIISYFCLLQFARGKVVPATLTSVAVLMILLTCIACFYAGPQPGCDYVPAATALKGSGLQPEDRIALIWDERWESGAAEGSFVPRLLRLKIIAEIPDAASFWKLDEGARQHAIELLRSTGARAILALNVPAGKRAGWRQLSNTKYYVFSLSAT